jgi:hypothetical protein
MHCRTLFLFLMLIALFSCGTSNQPAGPDPAHSAAPPSYPEKAVVHSTSFGRWDSSLIKEAAESKMIIFPISRCFSPEARHVLDELRRLNPDIQIIGYQLVMGVSALWPDTNYLRTTLPYDLDYYNAVRGDWAWTTAGDTLMIWKNEMFLNPIKNGNVNLELIETLVDLLARYQDQTGNAIDGIFHDYFMTGPHINPDIQDRVIGDVDFDGDGIIFNDDENEKELFMRWQTAYARAIRNRFGDDFIQVGNGHPPQRDPELAGLMNGIYYECFPNNPWWQADRTGFLIFLDNQREGYLHKAKGRTWSVCANLYGQWSNGNLFCLLSSLLGGCLYTEQQGSDKFLGWTLDIDTGAPRGATSIEGGMDSTLTVKREFERGEVRISFFPTGMRDTYLFDPTFNGSR